MLQCNLYPDFNVCYFCFCLFLSFSDNKASPLPRSEGFRTPKNNQFLVENLVLHFHIAHITLCLAPKILNRHRFQFLLRRLYCPMPAGQAKLKTMLTQNVWGETKCIMGCLSHDLSHEFKHEFV